MPNKTIPQLPEQTGKTDNDLLAIVDSGETTTSKIKVSTLLSGLGGVYESGTGTSSIKPVDGTNTASGNFSAVLNGNGNTQSGDYSIVTGLNNTGSGPRSFVIGGQNNTANNSLGNGGILGGQSNTSGARSGVVFGRSNNIGADGYTFGTENTITNTNNNPNRDAVILGGSFHYENTNGAARNTFLGGYANKIYNSFSDGVCNIWGGQYNWIDASGTYASPNYVGWTGKTNTIINSENSNIKNGVLNTIIGSDACVTSATTRTTIIGCSGFTATENDTTYVKHSKNIGQGVYNWFNNGSGSVFILDFNEGNLQEISMSADTIIDLTNVKIGGRYSIKVFNEASYLLLLMTATDFNVIWEGASIPLFTSGGTDLLVLEVFGSDILVRHFANFATAE